MGERSDSLFVTIRAAAAILACVFCVLIGWMIYQGSLSPIASRPNAGFIPPASSVSPAEGQGSEAYAGNPTFLTIPSPTGTVPVSCATFAGFSYAEDVANVEAALSEIKPYLRQNDAIPFQVDYRCDTKQGPTLATTYTFYSTWWNSSYDLIRFGKPGIPDDFDIYPISSPGSGCAKPLQWNVASAAVLKQFFAASGSAVFASGAIAGGSGSLDVKLACMPPGKMEWFVTADSGATGKTAYDEYPALTL